MNAAAKGLLDNYINEEVIDEILLMMILKQDFSDDEKIVISDFGWVRKHVHLNTEMLPIQSNK
jgi:hypothetical protein